LRDRAADFEQASAGVVLVGMGAAESSEAFLEQFQLPFPLICDPDRKLYDLYGLKRMGALGFLSPTLALKSLTTVAVGHRAGMPRGDVRQLAGVFVIDTKGMVRYRHLSANPSDFPPARDVLKAVLSI